MENVAEALKMAFAILMFVLALTLCISSFSQAREAVDSIITIKDRETPYYSGAYVKASNSGTRIVGAETIVPTLYKAYKENFEVHFLNNDGSELELYQYVDPYKNTESMSVIDLEQENHASAERAINRLNYILSGEKNGDDDPAFNEVTEIKKASDGKGLYSYLKEHKFEEKMGEYYQEDRGANGDSSTDGNTTNPSTGGDTTEESQNTNTGTLEVNKTKKRVIVYQLVN